MLVHSADMLAGPSEVLVIADETGDMETIAADLLAQVGGERHDTT
jgi:histidinol dehydrogenase